NTRITTVFVITGVIAAILLFAVGHIVASMGVGRLLRWVWLWLWGLCVWWQWLLQSWWHRLVDFINDENHKLKNAKTPFLYSYSQAH
ncbi:MAG: hypothetical protein WAM14_14970, partial [Candidatus Nitrosopolaris sp.]